MARWEPNAVGRLLEAAMELYQDPGYDNVTVAEIASHAGLTPRTFFRHFADKREVLFFGAKKAEALVNQAIAAAPEGTAALEVVISALSAIARLSDEDASHAELVRKRHALIQSYAELREREHSKHAALTASSAAALRARGIKEPTASLAAEAGHAAFKVGFDRWVSDEKKAKMETHLRAAARGLIAVAQEGAKQAEKRRR